MDDPGVDTSATGAGGTEWWRDAVVYEVYPRSFADSDGDGVGDLEGLRRRLPYLVALGVDAVWLAPWYPSPMADGGYDVSDYRDIHPVLGTLEQADALIADAHAAGIRVVVDLVANHTSEQHPWFVAALASPPGSPERARYFFRDGRGEDGGLPPNNWISAFGGSAWTRTTDPDGRPGQWYLHSFAAEQPDLDWANPEVVAAFEDVLRFWLDRGVDGFRVDAAPAMAKAPGLPDADYGTTTGFAAGSWVGVPHWDVDEVHELLRGLRRLADSHAGGDTLFVTESVVSSPEALSRYVRPDEMQTSFNFDFLKAPWDAEVLRRVIDDSLAAMAPTGSPTTWVLSSHDETRHVTRYGRDDTAAAQMSEDRARPSDPGLGRRRARAALALMLALPGTVYLYQGEELGLPEVEDLPDDVREDPAFHRSGGTVRGRDGCRVPLPWSGDAPPFGFSPPGVRTWLPQPQDWAALTVEAQEADPGSMLSFYRRALRLRRTTHELRGGAMAWRASPPGVLAFDRGPLTCVVSTTADTVPLESLGHDLAGAEVVLATHAGQHGRLPGDAALWLRRAAEGAGTTPGG